MPEVNLAIKGSDGLLEVNDDRVSLQLNDGKKSQWFRHDLNDSVGFWLGQPEYYREDAQFIESAKSGKNTCPSFRDASEVDRLIDTIREKADRR